jgi:hypothetical protein
VTCHLSICAVMTIESVWERYEFDIDFGEGYMHVRPFGSRDWALDRHMIDLAVVLSFLSLVLKI